MKATLAALCAGARGRTARLACPGAPRRFEHTGRLSHSMKTSQFKLQNVSHSIWSLVLSALVLSGIGCRTHTPSGQLARVAKDWCLIIRASQVLPVYPLMEDLVPGDLFLVQWPIEEQVAIYERDGFLPLDHHLKRTRPADYANLYLSSHGIGDGKALPYVWLFPNDGELNNSLLRMPLAAFPSYTFDVKRGGGLNLALPIQGVPIALSFLQAKSAKGSVILKDARTHGIDEESLFDLVCEWGRGQKDLLAQYAPRPDARQPGRTNHTFLRAVNRVFLVRQVSVSITADASVGGKLTGGADKDFVLPSLTETNSAANYGNFLNNLNASVAQAAMPGGTVKFSAASSHAVAMEEQFPRPLVIGYLAFDIPILANGELGGAASTLRRLESPNVRPGLMPVTFGADENTKKIQDWRSVNPAARRTELLTWARAKGYPYSITTYLEFGAPWRRLRKEFVMTVLENH